MVVTIKHQTKQQLEIILTLKISQKFIKGYNKIKQTNKSYEFNCGVGNGYSVLEILKTFLSK